MLDSGTKAVPTIGNGEGIDSYVGRKTRIPQLRWNDCVRYGLYGQYYTAFQALYSVKEAILFHSYVGNDIDAVPTLPSRLTWGML